MHPSDAIADAAIPTDAQRIAADDPRLRWPGAVSVEHADGRSRPWRLPYPERGLFAEPLVERARMPAGVRLSFRTDSTSVAGRVQPDDEIADLDLVIDGRLVASQPLAGRSSFGFDRLPGGSKRVELWLPQFGSFVLEDLWLDAGAGLQPDVAAAPKWIAYGSSITQCRTAASPTRTWPAIVAREHGLDLTCLGYGGQCHLDPSVARMIRDLDCDWISICAGINVHGGATLNPRTFRPALIGFLQIIRERHPQTPIAVMSPIVCPDREQQTNPAGFTLSAIRDEVEAAVHALTEHGDAHLHYVDGRDIFGDADAHLLGDGLHPDAEGYQLMGRRYREQVAQRMIGSTAAATKINAR